MTDIQKIADMMDDDGQEDSFGGGALSQLYAWVRQGVKVRATLTTIDGLFEQRSWSGRWYLIGEVEQYLGDDYDDGLNNAVVITEIETLETIGGQVYSEPELIKLPHDLFVMHATPRERRLSNYPNASYAFSYGLLKSGELRFITADYSSIETLFKLYFNNMDR